MSFFKQSLLSAVEIYWLLVIAQSPECNRRDDRVSYDLIGRH